MKKLILLLAVAFSLNTIAQIPINGLIAWFPFNGNANDASGNGHNGIVKGATLTTDRFGNANSAYYFNGKDDTIILNLVQTNISVWSISAWFKTTNGGAIVAGDNLATCLTLDIGDTADDGTNAGRVICRADGNAIAIGKWTNKTYTDNNWHNVVGVFNGTAGAITPSEFKVYIDDSLVSTFTTVAGSATAPINNTLPTLIGAHHALWGHSVFTGSLGDIRIYNVALDSADVSALYNESLCYTNITVTDTLVINANLTGFNPVTYNNTIKIYPNPTNTSITINAGTTGINTGYEIKILNTLSQVIYQQTIATQIYTVNLSAFGGDGVYFVQIYNPNGALIDIRKIVLE